MPRTRSRHATRITRRSPPRETHNGHGIRPSLKKNDLCVGCIVWLPSKIESEKSLVCGRGKSCCNGKRLNDDGYHHPVIILYYEGTICYVAIITSKTRQNTKISTRIPISQKPPDIADIYLDPEPKLYLEVGNMNKQSFVIIEHLFPVPVSMLRSISFKSDSKAFDTRLRKQSYLDLICMFDMNERGVGWVDTEVVKAKNENASGQRTQRVTFTDPWQEIRGDINTPTMHRHRENPRQSLDQRSHVTPIRSTAISTSTLPQSTSQTRTTLPPEPAREWYNYDRSTERSIIRELTAERQALLPRPSPLSSPPSQYHGTPTQSTRYQQYQTQPHYASRPPRSNYQAALPSVERYDRSHWDARIRDTNMRATRAHDLESGRPDGGDEEEGYGGRLFGELVVGFWGLERLFGGFMGGWFRLGKAGGIGDSDLWIGGRGGRDEGDGDCLGGFEIMR